MWSYMVVSSQKRVCDLRRWRQRYSVQGQPILENLALSPRGLAEPARRDAGRAAECAHEIGEIAETYIVGDIGDGAVSVGQQARRMLEPRAHQILVRGDAEHIGEQAQEVERADTGLAGGTLQIDLLG